MASADTAAPAIVNPAPEAPKPAPANPAPAPAATTANAVPAPAAPKAETPAAAPQAQPSQPAQAQPAAQTPPAPAVAPPPAPRKVEDEVDRLRKAADLMAQVNSALGPPQSRYGDLIYEIAIRHSVNPHLVAALIHVESSFNPKAVSRKGAYGLMQLLPETARRFGLTKKKDLFDPQKNLEAGVKYLKWLTNRFGGDVEKILAAYNAGEGAVTRFGGIPPYQETQNYVRRIFGLLGFSVDAPAPAKAASTSPDLAAAR